MHFQTLSYTTWLTGHFLSFVIKKKNRFYFGIKNDVQLLRWQIGRNSKTFEILASVDIILINVIFLADTFLLIHFWWYTFVYSTFTLFKGLRKPLLKWIFVINFFYSYDYYYFIVSKISINAKHKSLLPPTLLNSDTATQNGQSQRYTNGSCWYLNLFWVKYS